MLLVFVTLLCTLCFSTLFYQRPMQPVCLDADTEQCKIFACPSCYNIYGTNDCDDVTTHAPTGQTPASRRTSYPAVCQPTSDRPTTDH